MASRDLYKRQNKQRGVHLKEQGLEFRQSEPVHDVAVVAKDADGRESRRVSCRERLAGPCHAQNIPAQKNERKTAGQEMPGNAAPNADKCAQRANPEENYAVTLGKLCELGWRDAPDSVHAEDAEDEHVYEVDERVSFLGQDCVGKLSAGQFRTQF